MRVAVAGAVLVAATTAAAEPEYPLEITERPLLMYAGMADLDVSINFPTFSQSVAGSMTTTRTSIGDVRDVDILGTYSFGTVELGLGGVGSQFLARGRVAIGDFGAVDIQLDAVIPHGSTHDYGQSVGYTMKVHVVPHRFAAYAFVDAALRELATFPDGGGPMSGSGERLSTSLGAGAQLQLTPQLALTASPRVDIPIAHPGLPATSTELGAFSELELSFRPCDFYAQFALNDLTRTRLPFAAAGFVYRW